MPVKRGDVIKVYYEASYDDGTVFDSTEMCGGEPLKFQIGAGQIIGGFEDAVIGMEIGEEKKSFTKWSFLETMNASPEWGDLQRFQILSGWER